RSLCGVFEVLARSFVPPWRADQLLACRSDARRGSTVDERRERELASDVRM
ncbi:TBC1 domain family member 9, partial [Clarias magur]